MKFEQQPECGRAGPGGALQEVGTVSEEPDQGEQEAMLHPVEGREQGVGAVGGWEVRADQRAS